MNQNLLSRVLEFLRRKMWSRRWQRAVTCLAAVAVFGVTYALIMPAITMTNVHPTLSAEQLSAWSGDELTVKVTAEAEEERPAQTFVLKAKGEGADLSASYVFNEEGVCVITDEEGKEIELHRGVREEEKDVVDYWFTLEPGTKTAFTLSLTDEVDETRFAELVKAVKQEQKENAEEQETATASDAGKSEAPAAAPGTADSATASNADKATGSNADVQEANAIAKTEEEKVVTEKDDDGFEQILDGAIVNDLEAEDEEAEAQTEIVASLKLSAGIGGDFHDAVKDAEKNADKRGDSEVKLTWKDVALTVAKTPAKTQLEAFVNGAQITVYYDADAGIPDDATLSVEEYEEGSPEYEQCLAQAEEALQDADEEQGPKGISQARFFDITILGEEGNVIEPLSPVKVVITYMDAMELAEDGELNVLHFKEESPVLLTPGKVEGGRNVDAVSFTADSFSVYAVVASEPKTHKFEFYSEGSLYKEVILKFQEPLTQPDNPVPTQTGNVTFWGWYEDEAFTTPFTGFGQVPEMDNDKTSLYAKFVGETSVITYYYDGNVIRSDVVETGSPYTANAQDPAFVIRSEGGVEDKVLVNVAWNTSVDGTGTQYEDGDTIPTNADLDLYPVIELRYLVEFRSDGGVQTQAIFIPEGEKVDRPDPDPTWTGYSFDGWYTGTEQDHYQTLYDFDQPVTEHKTLYAKWNPQTVDYTVAVWVEKDSHKEVDVNGDPLEGEAYIEETFSYLGAVTKQAVAGTEVTAAAITGEHKTSGDAVIKGARQNYMPYVFLSDLSVAENQNVTVRNDGSTVVNLYYRYKTLKVGFKNKSGQILFDGQTFNTRYFKSVLIEGSFAESILSWTYLQTVYPNGHIIGGQWDILPGKKHYEGGYDYVTTCKTIGAANIDDGATYYVQDRSQAWNYTFARERWKETLESSRENDTNYLDTSRESKHYELQWENRRQFPGHSEGAYSGAISGFTIIHDLTTGYISKGGGANPLYSYYKYSNQSSSRPREEDATEFYFYVGGHYGSGYQIDHSPTKVTDGTECIIRWYARRNKYRIDLNKGIGPAVVNPTVSNIPYEEFLNRDEYKNPFSFVNNDGQPEVYKKDVSTWENDGMKYIFRGFYTNSDGMGDPVDLETMRMPAYNLQLYAKWEQISVKVTFDENGGVWNGWTGPDDPKDKTMIYGENVPKPTDPTMGDKTFLGWTLDGKLFSFASPITKDITLVALYADTHAYSLTYDENGGTGTVPVDTSGYLLNATAVATPGDALKKVEGENEYGFVAWSDQPTGGTLYYPGDVVRILGNTTLYAQYASDYPVTKLKYDFNPTYKSYNMAFKDSEGDPVSDLTVIEIDGKPILNNQKITLNNTQGGSDDTSNGFYKTTNCMVPRGYKFLGWATASDAETAVPEILVDVENEDTKNVVYAMWFRYETDVPVKKINNDENEPKLLPGAVFELRMKSGPNESDPYEPLDEEEALLHGLTADSRITIGEDGIAVIGADGQDNKKGLFDGDYQLVEVKAPAGHILLGTAISFSIDKGIVTYEGTDPMVEWVSKNTGGEDGGNEGEDDGYFGFIVKNAPGTELPSTGGPGTMHYAIGGILLLMVSALLYGFRMRHEERRCS